MKFAFGNLQCALVVILGISRPLVTAGAKEMATPMQKVLQLLAQMKTKGEKEMGEERVEFSAFSQFCNQKTALKKGEIEEATDQIESLEADIERYSTDAAKLSGEINAHASTIQEKKDDIAKNTEVRKAEEEDYAEAHKDLSESVDAMGRAIGVLKKQDYDRAQANKSQPVDPDAGFNAFKKNESSFLQLGHLYKASSRLKLTEADWEQAAKALELAQQMPTKPKVDAYEFQAGGIIDMLTGLEEKFVEEKRALEKSETKKKQSYEMLQSSLQIEVDMHTTAKGKKEGFKSKALADKAQAQASKEEVEDSRAEDQKYHNDLTTECKIKSADFAQRQKVRALEIEAVDKAVDILKDLTLLQGPKAGTVLATLRSKMLRAKHESGEKQILQFLQEQASALHSRTLDRLVMQVSAAPASTDEGIMNYIEQLLRDLLTKLQETDIKETELKSYCDEELKTNSQTRATLTEDETSLQAEIDVLQTAITKLTEDSTKLKGEVADLDSSMAEATKMRNDEKATNQKGIKEAREGRRAVTAAIAVLKDFYESAMGTILMQRQADSQKPEFAAGEYKGNGQQNIINMLEAISSDFSQEEAETKASEEAALKSYRAFIVESKVEKAKKAAAAKRYAMKASHKTMTANDNEVDLKATQDKLQSALDYFEGLKPKCVDTNIAYEKEQAERKDTIESLQKALTMLNDYRSS